MRTSSRIGLVGGLSALLVLSAVGIAPAAPREVPTKQYAKTVCGVYSDLATQVSDFADALNADTSSDPATLQSEVGTLTDGLLDDVAALRIKLKNVYPDVDDGKRITKLFVKNLDEISDRISSALDKLQAADPAGAAFQGDVSTFETAIGLLDTKTSDPFSKVTDQDVLRAFDKEKGCKKIVQVTTSGG